MAIEKTIKLNVDSTQANASLNETEKELRDLGKAADESAQQIKKPAKAMDDIINSSDSVNKKLKDLDVTVSKSPKNFRDLNKQIQAYQTIALQAGRESAVGRQALQRAAQLKDQMVDLQNETKRLADDNYKLQGAIGIGTGVLAGFTAFNGVMSMAGVESEELRETMVKLQAAQAALAGITQLQVAFQKESAAMLVIQETKTKALALAQRILGKSATGAGKAMRIALASTGIGLFVVALGTIVAYWDDIKKAVSGVSEEQQKLNEVTQQNAEAQIEKLNAIDGQTNQLKLQGKSEREILEIKRRQIDAAIEEQEISLETAKMTLEAQLEAEKRNKSILEGILLFVLSPIQLLLGAIDGIIEGLVYIGAIEEGLDLRASVTESLAEIVFDPAEVQSEGEALIKEQEKVLAELKERRAGNQLAITNIDKSASDKRKEDQQKELSDKQQKLEQEAQLESEFREKKSQLEDEYLQSKISKEQQEVNAVYEKYFALIEAAKQYGEDTVLLEEAQQAAIKEIQDRYQAERDAAAEIQKEKEKSEDKAELEREAALRDAKIQMAQQSLQAISDLVKAFAGESEEAQRRAFNINKAISIGQAIISTAQGIITQLAVPQDALTGANFIKAGIVAATGAAQIATISATQFQASGSGGGGGASPTAPNPPTAVSSPATFNVVGNTGTNQLAETLGQQPLQAYVVAGDVTTAQSLERNKIQQSTL